MNKPAADDELIREYLVESNEHLATIESDLLEVESAGADIDEQLVNRVFRAAHSIKGGAGFFDLTRIRELAHKTESVLDLIRSRQMVPTPEVVSVLLLAFDRLRDLLADWKNSNSESIDEFLSALSGLTTNHLPESRKAAVRGTVSLPVPGGSKLIEVAAFDLDQARRGGRTIYLIEYDLIRDLQRKNKSPIEVLSKLGKCGTILDAHCDFEQVGTLEDEPQNLIPFHVLYSSALEPELINDLLEVPPVAVTVIEKKGTMRPLTDFGSVAEEESVPESLPLPPQSVDPVSPRVELRSQRDSSTGGKTAPAENTIRLNVGLLDTLMNLAGEMVLSRNQLNDAVSRTAMDEIRSSAHRLSLVTSELQAAVALTRMQPVGSLFAKFPRVVRDLARDLGKDAQLRMEGGDVEIDKSILEGLSDPLTHMIRNAVDHGLESIAERVAAGKPQSGTVTLRASHQAGQVVIEISDDGKGLSGEKVGASMLGKGMIQPEQLQAMSEREKMMLIFLPGVSTAEKLSDVSGRGVGMDVVKTNLDRLGGKIEIESELGRGTRFRIKLPLTLAIIPSLLVSNQGRRFALPQVNVSELIRISADQVQRRIDLAGDRPVLLLRDRLVPLVFLRSLFDEGQAGSAAGAQAWHIVLVDSGSTQYGLVVDALHDTVEIVVKPLGRHLQGIGDYAGATILGDGQVALILDVAGIAARAGLREGVEQTRAEGPDSTCEDTHSLLLFECAPGESCALPIEYVTRVERVTSAEIQHLGGRRSWKSGNGILPVVALSDATGLGSLEESQQWVVVVFEQRGKSYGLLAAEPLDLLDVNLSVDTETLRQPGIAGSLQVKGKTTLLLDLAELTPPPARGEEISGNAYSDFPGEFSSPSAHPHSLDDAAKSVVSDVDNGVVKTGTRGTVLVAEDSDFFRSQICRLVEAVGYQTLSAPDGQAAWELLDRNAGRVDLVATDVEMPRLDGISLTRRIRGDGRFASLPVIALSSLAGEQEIARGLEAGVSEYQIKLDPDLLLASIDRAVTGRGI